MEQLLPGKLPPHLLVSLLARCPTGPRVVLGPRAGEDAAVLDMGDRYLVAKSDPVTFATDEIGWYAVQVNANDIATTGATPLWFMATILLPAGSATPDLARAIFDQIAAACRALDVAVIGGHTEITPGIDRPLVTGCMLGEVARDRLVLTGGARPGDVILLTKGAPIEATAIIARERRGDLQGRFEAAFLDHCADFLYRPGISVVQDARIAVAAGGVTAMHDPTEGGVVTALWELVDACGHGVDVDLYGEAAPWLPEAVALCGAFGLDPAAAIASGALLLTADPGRVAAIRQALEAAGIAVYELGTVTSAHVQVLDRRHGPLTRPARDAITHLFDQ